MQLYANLHKYIFTFDLLIFRKRITKVGAAVAIAHGQQAQKKIKTSIARELSTTF